MAKRIFEPDVAAILHARGCERPEAAVDAARREVAPLVSHLRHRLSGGDLGSLEWILVELLLNAALVTQRNKQAAPPGVPPVSVELVLPADGQDFDIRVMNAGLPTPTDRAQLDQRFRNYDKTRLDVEEDRRKHTDPSGRVRVPGGMGGGGLGLLECIRTARRNGFVLEYFTEDAPIGRTVFRVAREGAAE